MIGKKIPLFLTSVDEPQLPRAIKSTKNQNCGTFNPVFHRNNVAPQSQAMNELNEEAREYNINGWALWLSGDMILYNSAIERIISYLTDIDPPNENTVEYTFGLRDTFLEENICGCPLRKMDVYSKTIRKNVMRNDFYVRRELEKQGYEYKRPCKEAYTIGTHFDSPDNFQIFRRFKARGVKARKNPKERDKYLGKLKKLALKNCSDIRYKYAVSAFEYGYKRASTVGAHDITIDEVEFWLWWKNEK